MRVIKKIPVGKPIDVTDSKKLGRPLAEEILERVKATQKYLETPLPDKLLLSKAQFESLETDPEMKGATNQRLWFTGENIMDVVVQE